jgi:hypothetical protein
MIDGYRLSLGNRQLLSDLLDGIITGSVFNRVFIDAGYFNTKGKPGIAQHLSANFTG